MKQVTILLVFLTVSLFATAQQNTTTATTKQSTPVMKVDSKPSTVNAPVASPAKACCAGKTAAECSHAAKSKSCSKEAAAKSCAKEGEAKACCQKGGSTHACSHGAEGKATEQKAQ